MQYDEVRKLQAGYSALIKEILEYLSNYAKEEKDERFVRVVWNRAAAGATPEQCESSIVSDSYRIRALLAHWVEEAALAPRV